MIKAICRAGAVVVFAALPLIAQPRIIKIPAKRALTHEMLWLMRRVGTPVPSPDGKWVVFPLTIPSYDEKEQSSDLWLVPADGSVEPRQITSTKASENDVVWSNDSKRIAFSSKREGDDVAQIYVLDIAGGGEARRVTSLSTGARSPQFRPDDSSLLFTSTVYPGAADDDANRAAAKERKEQKAKVRVYDSFPIRVWDRWLDDTQVHLFVQELDGRSKPRDVLAGSTLVTAPGFAGRVAEGSREDIEAAWSPDGKTLVFGATTERNAAAYAEVSSDLYAIGGQPSDGPRLIAHEAGAFSRPRFSPDGKHLFAIFTANNKKPYNLERLVRFDWPSMTNRITLTGPPFDRSVGSFALTADGSAIYFTAEDAGLEKIYKVSSSGGEVKLLLAPERGVYTNLAIAAAAPDPVIVALWGSTIDPPEVVRIDPAGSGQRELTDFNQRTARNIDWLPPKHFWFTSSRGKKIHNMIVMPAAFDSSRKYPLFVLIHGGAASMWRDALSLRWNYHLLAGSQYVVLLTNYTGSTGFGEKFAQDIQGDPLKGPADEINEAADAAVKQFPFIDGTRMSAGGASYGGHLANWLEATTTRYKCLISHAGLINLESQWGTSDTIYGRELLNGGPVWEQNKVWKEQNPIRYAARFKTPMLLSVGEHDFRVPMNETLENWSALQRQRVPSRLLIWPDENHWILNGENSKRFYREVADWLAKWMPAEGAKPQ